MHPTLGQDGWTEDGTLPQGWIDHAVPDHVDQTTRCLETDLVSKFYFNLKCNFQNQQLGYLTLSYTKKGLKQKKSRMNIPVYDEQEEFETVVQFKTEVVCTAPAEKSIH